MSWLGLGLVLRLGLQKGKMSELECNKNSRHTREDNHSLFCAMGMTNYRNRHQQRQIGPKQTARNCKGDGVNCQEPQQRQLEAQRTVGKCKGNGVSCQKLH